VNDDVLNEETDPDWVILYVDIGNVDAALGITRKEEIRFEDAPSRARRRVADGDTIVSTVRTYLKAIAPIDRPEPNLVVSTGFAVIRPRDIDSRFMAYCLRSSYFVETVVSHSVGVSYPATNPSEIMTILIPLPMLAEQQSIAAFLDRETRHIDLLVKTKRKLIERLKEKRSALISRTVTRGLPQEAARATGMPENPPLKPTNNDWIREIPAHWDIVPYKRMCTRVDVGIAEAATHAYCDDGVPIIRSKNVKPNRLDASELLRIEPWFAEKNRSKTLHSGDLVTVRTGYPGTTAIVPPELDGSQCFTLVLSTPKKATHGPFYSWFLNSQPGATYFEAEGWGTAQTNISVPIVQFMPVPRPPHAEQVAISNYLKKETAKFDRLIIATETAIERLQEYRAALINAAVTGKIDVGRSIA
jgi:type I restriction enzyme S subunit